MFFYCVSVQGPGINYDVGDALLVAAYEMTKSWQKSKKVKTSTHEGEVITDFKRVRLSEISGIQFTANLEHNHGESEVVFILRDADIEKIAEQESLYAGMMGQGEEEVSVIKRKSPLRKARKTFRSN